MTAITVLRAAFDEPQETIKVSLNQTKPSLSKQS